MRLYNFHDFGCEGLEFHFQNFKTVQYKAYSMFMMKLCGFRWLPKGRSKICKCESSYKFVFQAKDCHTK